MSIEITAGEQTSALAWGGPWRGHQMLTTSSKNFPAYTVFAHDVVGKKTVRKRNKRTKCQGLRAIPLLSRCIARHF